MTKCNESISEQLNEYYKSNSSIGLRRKIGQIKFFEGDCFDNLNLLLKRVAPNGCIALFNDIANFNHLDEEIINFLRKDNRKYINFIVDKKITRLEDTAKYFNTSDDVRAVIFTDNSLGKLCSYFANIKNIPIIYIPSSTYVEDSILSSVTFKIDNEIEDIDITADRYILLDDKKIEDDLSETYISNILYYTSIFDYIFYKELFKPNEYDKFFNVLLSSAEKSLHLGVIRRNEVKPHLLLESFKIQIIRALTRDFFVKMSPLYAIKNLYDEKICPFRAFMFFAGVYSVLSLDDAVFDFLSVNINSVADETSNLFGISNTYVLEKILSSSKMIEQKENNIKIAKGKMKDKALILEKALPIISKVFTSLGGEKMERDDKTLKALIYSANLSEFSAMQVAREYGFLPQK